MIYWIICLASINGRSMVIIYALLILITNKLGAFHIYVPNLSMLSMNTFFFSPFFPQFINLFCLLTVECCEFQDFECLRRIAGCRDIVSQEEFERIWCWLYPIAFTLSQSAVKEMWNSTSPIWIEGFITKEEAESMLQGVEGGLQEPGTFVLRFPTSRSWPHPDAGNLVVTYVGSDYTMHHRLLSFDFINGYTSSSLFHFISSSHIVVFLRSTDKRDFFIRPLQFFLQENYCEATARFAASGA